MVEDTITIQLILDAKNDDRAAKEEMIRAFQPVLFYMGACHLNSGLNTARAVKKTLDDLLKLLDEITDVSCFEEKAMNIAVRNFLNAALREDTGFLSAKGSDPHEADVCYTDADETRTEHHGHTEKEAMGFVSQLLKKLPDDQRMTFVMHYLDGLSFEKMAERIHVPEETLKKRAQLAKDHLSEINGTSMPEIFGIIALAEENKHLVLKEPEPQPAPEEAVKVVNEKPARDRKKLIPAAGAAGAVLALAGFTMLARPETVSLLSYAKPVFSGYDGAGSVSVTYSESEQEAVNEILESGICRFVDAEGNETDTNSLSNGDTLTYACVFDEEALKKANIVPQETSLEVTVDGLEEPKEIDLFKGVTLDTEKDDKTGEFSIKVVSEEEPQKYVSYLIVSETEDEVTVKADITDEEMLRFGYYTKTKEHVFSGEETARLIKAYQYANMIASGEMSVAPIYDEFGAEIANGSDPYINEVAQRLLGMGGACTEVARVFILELYGVDIGQASRNIYSVDSPEPGDLVKYYDEYGNFTHVATYIGNGQVLNGNYNGSTHITSIYDSMYASNPMSYHRVSR